MPANVAEPDGRAPDAGIDVLRHPSSNPDDLIRNLIPLVRPRRGSVRQIRLLQTALSMLSAAARGNQTGNKAPAARGGGAAACWPCGSNAAPLGPSVEGTCEAPADRSLSTEVVITFH